MPHDGELPLHDTSRDGPEPLASWSRPKGALAWLPPMVSQIPPCDPALPPIRASTKYYLGNAYSRFVDTSVHDADYTYLHSAFDFNNFSMNKMIKYKRIR